MKNQKGQSMAFPKRVAVTIDPNANGSPLDSLLAWKSVEAAEAGKVAIYELVDEIEKRETFEIRRKGKKGWLREVEI